MFAQFVTTLYFNRLFHLEQLEGSEIVVCCHNTFLAHWPVRGGGEGLA